VNRDFRLAIHFTCAPAPRFADDPRFREQGFYLAADLLNPAAIGRNEAPVTLTRDQFLRVVVMAFNGTVLTVRDMIRFEANIGGGVHVDDPSKLEDRMVAEINKQVYVWGLRPTLHMLTAVGHGVLAALAPLRAAVRSATG